MKLLKTLLAATLALVSAIAFAAVDVNRATQAELEGVKGIGPSMSTKILEARKAGAFKDWADLQARVKGVHDRRSIKLSAQGLTVNGATYAATGEPATTGKALKTGKAPKAAKAADAGMAAHSAS